MRYRRSTQRRLVAQVATIAIATATLMLVSTSGLASANTALDTAVESTASPHTAPRAAAGSRCAWPMWGRDAGRSFATDCTELTPESAADLRRIWYFNTHDVVTATPAVVGNTVYVGDWSGRFYALKRSDGTQRWVVKTKTHPRVYAGQIVSSAAVAKVGGVRTVFVGAGKTMYAFRASDGEERWTYELGEPGDKDDPTEIEASPVIVDGMVIFGWDVHNSPAGEPAGVVALDARTGKERWRTQTAPTEGANATGSGCADVWGSVTVDTERRLAFFGTGNCVTSPRGWGRFTEAIVALDLDDGAVRWAYQPHEPNRDDLDFAGAPNLFEATRADGTPRALVGLGGKDGTYYALDRDTGEPVWVTPVVEPGLTRPGSNFSTGGFIGPAGIADGIIAGGTAIGGDPYLHGLATDDGAIAWQQPIAAPTYGAPAIGGGVLVIGGTDFTMRALDLATGAVLWSDEVDGAVSGGSAIVGPDVFAVAGIREPGLDARSRTSGVYRYSLRGKPVTSTSAPADTKKPNTPKKTTGTTAATSPPAPQSCVGTPCDVGFTLVQPPAGTSPTMTLHVTLDPWKVAITTSGLGPPSAWLRPGSAEAATGATRYGVFLSESDDNPQGGLLCVLDAQGSCTSAKVPRKGATYSRLTILAITDSDALPSPAEGVNRLVVTRGFDPLLLPIPKKK